MGSKGAFITLEGIDGCGKTTQADLLCRWLAASLGEENVLRTFEPGGWDGGELLRKLLLGDADFTARTELLLFLADRSGHIDTKIAPALEAGKWVVCERYTDSTLAYQSWGRGVPFEELNALLNWCRFPVPDLTIFLEIDEKTASSRLRQRGKLDRVESSGGDFMARAALGFKELAGRNPERAAVADASSGPETVAEKVRLIVSERLPVNLKR